MNNDDELLLRKLLQYCFVGCMLWRDWNSCARVVASEIIGGKNGAQKRGIWDCACLSTVRYCRNFVLERVRPMRT